MVGGVPIGGGAPVSVQSMTNTDTKNVFATIGQIMELAEAGCEIVRVAVPDEAAASALSDIVSASPIPVVADIHFDYRLALASLEAGIGCLRLNPGNIGERWRVNAGSLDQKLLQKHGKPTAQAMVESALGHIAILEELDFFDIKVSLKASSINLTVEAYRILADKVDYPFHIGISEAGTRFGGTIKSSAGIGILLSSGLGDTVRVSLTDNPIQEVKVAYEILKVLAIRQIDPEIISCPTCGRCDIDLIKTAEEVTEALRGMKKPIKVAVMGCTVNGPGEAREADIGVAGGNGFGLIFRNGEIIRKVKSDQLRDALLEEVDKL